MIEKLRKKFIIATMCALTLVLTVIVGGVAIFNYHSILTTADSTLKLLQENDGRFPDEMIHGEGAKMSSAELPFETRYFSVVLTEEGSVISTNTGKIAAVDSETANLFAKQVYNSTSTTGFVGQYRFIEYGKDNQIWVIFLDCGRDMNSFKRTVTMMIFVCVAGLLVVLLILIFLSSRIMKPFVENEAKQKRFITDAGHELKTPLTIINADAQVLEMDYGENEWLNDITNQTKRLADLTNELIYLSKMEEGRQESVQIDFPFSDVVQEQIDSFTALAVTKNRELTSNIEPLVTIHGDEKALGRLVTIFLDNAMKYSDEGGKISVSLAKKKNAIILEVSNTCQSMSQENIEHLFDRFYRTDSSRNSSTGGYGLGLSIASAIVNAHKGKINASTKDGKSLTITVTFPNNGKNT